MAIDFSKPVPADGYVALLAGIQAALTGLAQGLEPTDSGTHSNVPSGARRWNGGIINKWEKFNGTSWVENSSIYAINISGAAATVPFTGLTGTPTVWNQNTTGTAANVTGIVAVANGGTGASSIPTWNQSTTGAAAKLTGGVAGAIPWQSAASTTGFSAAGTAGQTLVSGGTGAPTFTASPTFTAPALGTPASGTLDNCTLPYSKLTGTIPTWNQSTTGNAQTATTATNQSGGTINATTGNLSGDLTVGNATATANLYLNAGTAAANGSNVRYQKNSVLRWIWGTSDTEAGANSGSLMYLFRYSDAGAYLGATMTANRATGNVVFEANVTGNSDERLKKNWRNLPADFIEKLAQVKSGIYDRTDIELTQVGVSAQSLQKFMPDAVLTGADEILSVAYGNAALAACVELSKAVVLLQAEIKELKNGLA